MTRADCTCRRITPVAGSPARMSAGPTPVRLDNEWATAMNRREVRVVSGLTAPLLGRYGYPAPSARPIKEDDP